MAIREKDGKILVHCHAGCAQRDIIAALREKDLWESDRRKQFREVVATYDYCDEHGELKYQVVRLHPKGFLQRRPDGYGGWIWKKHPQQILYRLPEVVRGRIVLMVEGEKDVETLRSHGFVATTIAGGAKAPWLPAFTDALRGREVVLIPDDDEPGWALMRRIANSLLGNAARIICFDDHHRVGAKDITEWFEAGHSEIEFVSRLEGIAWRSK